MLLHRRLVAEPVVVGEVDEKLCPCGDEGARQLGIDRLEADQCGAATAGHVEEVQIRSRPVAIGGCEAALAEASQAEGLVLGPRSQADLVVKAVAAGFAIASFVPAVAILNIVLLDAHIPSNPLTIFLLFCPISIGYAIARHNLFEVDRFLRLGVVYGALSLVVFATYAGLVFAGKMLVGSGQPLPAEIGALYIVVVLLVANPPRERVQTAVDRLFHRQTYSYRGTVVETSRRLASLLGTRQITESVLHVLTDVMTRRSAA